MALACPSSTADQLGELLAGRALVRDGLAELVSALDVSLLGVHEAAELVSYFGEVANLASAGKLLCAKRVAETSLHFSSGARTPAEWLAKATGESLGEAIGALETAAALEAHPELDEALRSGELSMSSARVIAAASGDVPGSAEELIELGREKDHRLLRRRAEQLKARARSEADEEARHASIRARRYLRHWREADGAVAGRFLLAPADAAPLLAAIEVGQQRIFEQARDEGLREKPERYAADALCTLAGAGGGPRAQVLVRVDAAALRRGERQEDELCEIAGVGQVSVAAVRELLSDAVVDMVVKDGVDVCSVTSLKRTIRRPLRIALVERDPACVVPGCGIAYGLEIDHWGTDFALGGPTELANLARICKFHHRMKTHRGWKLLGGPGAWRFDPPDPHDQDDGPGPFA